MKQKSSRLSPTQRLLRSAPFVTLILSLLAVGSGPAKAATLGVVGVRVTGYVECNHSNGSGEAPTSLELDVKGSPNVAFVYELPFVGNNTARAKSGPTYEISFMAYIPKDKEKVTVRNRVNCDGDWGQLNSRWKEFKIDRKRSEIRRNFCLNDGCDPKVATALGQCIVGTIAGEVPLNFNDKTPSVDVHETIQGAFARLATDIKSGKYRALGVAIGCLPLNVEVQSIPVQPRVSPIEPTPASPEIDQTPAEPLSPAPIAPANTGYQVVTDRPAAFLQSQPTIGSSTVAQFANGTPITMICQTSGDQASVAPFPDNATWDYVSIGGLTGYISDMRTNTAGDGLRTNLPNGGYFLSSQGIPQCQNRPQQTVPTPTPVSPNPAPGPATPAPTTVAPPNPVPTTTARTTIVPPIPVPTTAPTTTTPPTPGPVIVGNYTITTDRPVAFLQAQPFNNAATLATFPNGATVEMICQTSGDQTGVQPYPTNATWDYVRVGGKLGYIADMRLDTPGTGPRTNLPNGGYFYPSAGIPTC